MSSGFNLWGTEVGPGECRTIDLKIPELYTHSGLSIPVHVVHGVRSGPRLCITAAIHGDEINGVEIIRRLLRRKALRQLRGTLLAVPVVNVYGFINQSRYLPDRRDLNRSFPGSSRGSLTARVAHLVLEQLSGLASHVIDLHTAAVHRENLPHLRAQLDLPEVQRMAHSFGVPVILNSSRPVEGSLRSALTARGVPVVVYEGGEALRFNELAIQAGLKGILGVMRELRMLPKPSLRKPPPKPYVARSSGWVRAHQSGIFRALKPLGERVDKNDPLGVISDPYGEREELVRTPAAGIIIGKNNLPLVNEGEGLYHIARFRGASPGEDLEEFFRFDEMGEEDERPAGDAPVPDAPGN